MSPERRVRSQQPQQSEAQILLALQQLETSLQPTPEGSEAEKTRLLGLKTFYTQMVDPSLPFVESVVRSLVSTPFVTLHELQFATYNASENPARFFGKHGVAVDVNEDFRYGITNSGSVINDLVHRYDYETGELRWGENLDPQFLAEAAFESIQISNGERQIKIAATQVRNASDLRRRYRKGLSLKRQVLGHIGNFDFKFYRPYDRDEAIEPTWENLSSSRLRVELNTKGGHNISGSFELKGAIATARAALKRYSFEKRLEKLPTKNKERFDELKLQYGAKGANLIILSELVEQINKLRKNSFLGPKIAVPEFQVMSVDSYRAWREGHLLDDELRPYFDWANGLIEDDTRYDDTPSKASYLVRSSAVYSEDGENVTGAGVYDSVRVFPGSDLQTFKDAVTQVYKSTESSQAQAYRAQNGIPDEKMGLVIQKYISPSWSGMYDQSRVGYINSRLPGVPQLMEFRTETSRNFINRDELDFFLGLEVHRDEDAFSTVHHFPPDQYKVDPEVPINVAQFAYIVEKIWGKDIQAEFVADGSTINFVQVRELPKTSQLPAQEIIFPEEEPIHTGASIGVGDLELPVLDSEKDNSDKSGAVVFVGNYGWSIDSGNNYRLPKEGAVIITGVGGSNGHIQTLCSEQGIICVFPIEEESDIRTSGYRDLIEMKKVRVVSNGMEARVYEVNQEH